MLRIAAVEMPMQKNIRLTRQPRDRAASRCESADLVPILNCALPLNGQRMTEFWSLLGQSYFAAQPAPVFANLTPCCADCRDFPVTTNDH
jgi:hypothetical protein